MSDSPSAAFRAVFEDEGNTGYLYACDRTRGSPRILDAVHIYDAWNVVDRDVESIAAIGWSSDGLEAVLVINGWAHAVIDFGARCCYTRSGFPPPDNDWSRGTWSDDLLGLFDS